MPSQSGLIGFRPTGSNVFNACQHLWPGITRPDLNLAVTVTFSIRGILTGSAHHWHSIDTVRFLVQKSGKPAIHLSLNSFACPFQLPGDVA